MSRQVRHRLTAVLLGALVLATPLLTIGTANARQPPDDPACRAEPDVDTLTVPADSKVRVVNRTGYRAELRLDGTVRGVIPDDGSVEVIVRRAGTAVVLSPICASGQKSDPVRITTAASTPSTAGPAPLPLRSATPKKPKTKIHRGTGDHVPTSVRGPSAAQKGKAHGVPKRGFPPPTGLARAARAVPTADVAESGLTARRPIPQQGLIGLLAAVAMVCVVGVATGVIRAIAAERAFRTKMT